MGYGRKISLALGHNSLTSLRGQLEIDWPNLNDQSLNGQFWEAQWNKHGTCSLNNFKQLQYFSLAIGIKNKLDILRMLENAGIRPNATVTYNYIDIVRAIKAEIGPFEPELYCGMPHNNVVLLLEVRVCRDAMGATYISCVNNNNSCQGYLINIPE
ncbi:ribonuclease 3-like [Arachis stenosperma]|uniref:ribonuclease 3-like n=1 Tax=Arachis stenosperma TaxID=217475 RepID=UPI0025ACF9F3|nr:ribonuclease 3-like [Arachis stenosperma]